MGHWYDHCSHWYGCISRIRHRHSQKRGEKNYLEYVYRHPKYLATGFYTGYALLLGWAGSNSVVFGEYILHAARVEVTRFNQRGIGLACITAAFLIHGTALKWGLRLQNLLGIIKLFIVLLIVVSGWVSSFSTVQATKYGIATYKNHSD